jgi:hypothetical protein
VDDWVDPDMGGISTFLHKFPQIPTEPRESSGRVWDHLEAGLRTGVHGEIPKYCVNEPWVVGSPIEKGY